MPVAITERPPASDHNPLPEDPTAEEAVIGACLSSSPAIIEAVATGLDPSDFVSTRCSRTWDAIRRLHHENIVIDEITVGAWLIDHGHAGDDIRPWLARTQLVTPNNINVAAHAGRVIDVANNRRAIARATEITSAVRHGEPWGHHLDELHDLAQRAGGHDPARRLRGRLLDRAGLAAIPPPTWLIDSHLPARSLAVLYGPPGSLKTFVAVDWAASIATGSWWQRRHAVAKGPVLYLVGEGAPGFNERLAAWEHHHRMPPIDQIRFLTGAVNLLDRDESHAFQKLCEEAEPALIVIDTLARCLIGGNENDARDMGIAINHVDTIRESTGATILLLHHTNRAGTNARGSSSLDGAADTMIETGYDGQVLKLSCTKQKDDQPFEPLYLHFHTIEGATKTSGVVVPPGRGTGVALLGTDPASREMLGALSATETGTGMAPRLWEELCDGVTRRTFYRRLKALLDEGFIVNLGSEKMPKYALTPAGLDSLSGTSATPVPTPGGTAGGSATGTGADPPPGDPTKLGPRRGANPVAPPGTDHGTDRPTEFGDIW